MPISPLIFITCRLHHLGLDKLDLPLPKIVVVGDQSTGKSSLIEGMSEIKVPRSSGTCTRCPLEINLSDTSTDAWSCKVFLCKKYMYEGTQGQVATRGKGRPEAATRQRPLGPWILQDTEEIFFATVFSKEVVPDVLKLAQLATLNPSKQLILLLGHRLMHFIAGTDPKRYMPGNVSAQEDYLQVKFSPNVIRLDISGQGLPNLSFYDLPGVINVSDTPEEGYLVSLVKNLVKEYVQAEDSINLLAIPMTDDPANSTASQLIRELKAEARTLGVLTKPDRRQVGEAMVSTPLPDTRPALTWTSNKDQWSQILNGVRFRLGLGYYVVKNNPDPKVDHVTARAEEADFFSNEEPWAELIDKSRFGTLKLQTTLSQLLTDQIRKKLPQILQKVYQKAENIDDMLRELPEPISGNLPAMVLGELMKFNDQLQQHLDGGRRHYPFQKTWNDLASIFRKTLGDTRPILNLPRPQRDGSEVLMGTPTPNGRATINIDSDDEDMPTPTMSQSSGIKRRAASTSLDRSPSKAQKAENGDRAVQSKAFDLAEIKSLIQEAYAGGVPNQTHPKATEEMIGLSIAHWHVPLDQFLSATEQLCESMVFERVHSVFGGRQGTQFFEQIISHCEVFFKDVFAQQRQVAKRILSWELAKPQTLNEEAMSIARDKALKILQEHRRKAMAYELICEQEQKSGKPTTGQARMEKVARVNESQLKPEIYGQELHAMSVRSSSFFPPRNLGSDSILDGQRVL